MAEHFAGAGGGGGEGGGREGGGAAGATAAVTAEQGAQGATSVAQGATSVTAEQRAQSVAAEGLATAAVAWGSWRRGWWQSPSLVCDASSWQQRLLPPAQVATWGVRPGQDAFRVACVRGVHARERDRTLRVRADSSTDRSWGYM